MRLGTPLWGFLLILGTPFGPFLGISGSLQQGCSDDDADDDGVEDQVDNCPNQSNPDQADQDGDATGDLCDSCVGTYQPVQADADRDGIGDACEECRSGEDLVDSDGDGVRDCFDSCPTLANASQADSDGDRVGDACDNCPAAPNAGQSDVDGDGIGDACAPTGTFELEEASVASIRAALSSGTLTCEALVNRYLDRIHRYNLDISDGAPINAIVELDPLVLEEARALDASFRSTGSFVGPLHCAPIVLKDNYDSIETSTTQGSLSLLDTFAPTDAFAVAQMREAGAIILGKATMDELAQQVIGISGRSGRTGNAYEPDFTPGGSSGGTGAAVSANFALMGTGSDNCASVRLPAAYNGLNSLRPSTGLISLSGIFPGSSSPTGVGGPMARSLEDLTLLLDAMVGVDPADPKTQDGELVRPATYTAFLNPDGLVGKRIGILRSYADIAAFSGTNEDDYVTFNRVFSTLETLGATVIDNVVLPDFSSAITNAGYVEGVDLYLQGVDSPRASFAEMCQSGLVGVYPSVEECMLLAETNQPIDSEPYRQSQETQVFNRETIEAIMDDLSLDALVYPVDPMGAASDSPGGANCQVSAYSGMPSIVLRAGYSKADPRMPVGIEFMARKFDEPTLIEVGYAWETHTGWRRAPALTSVVAQGELPALDLEALNALHLSIGQAAYDQVIRDLGMTALTAEVFTGIVQEQLSQSSFAYLLGP